MSVRVQAMMTAAGLCGAGAFVWALALAPAERAPMRGRGGTWVATWPHEVRALERYVEDHAHSAGAWDELARRRQGSGDLPGAQEAWKKTAEAAFKETGRRTDDPQPSFILGWASDKTGDPATARIAFRRAARLYEAQAETRWADGMLWRNLGWCRQRLGDAGSAEAAWKRAVELTDSQTFQAMGSGMLYNLACYRALAGDKEGALTAMEQAVEIGWRDRMWAEQDEDLDSLRGEDRFKAAMERMTAPAQTGTVTGG